LEIKDLAKPNGRTALNFDTVKGYDRVEADSPPHHALDDHALKPERQMAQDLGTYAALRAHPISLTALPEATAYERMFDTGSTSQ
jgi:hypothetical protein